MSTSPENLPISICILAHNEEKNIPDCIASVVHEAAEVIVVDAGSTDGMPEWLQSAKKKYANLVVVATKNNPNLNVNKTLGFSKATQPWLFYLDADERFTPALWSEVSKAISSDGYNGYMVGRKNHYFGVWLRYGGMYPEKQPRLFRAGKGAFANKHIHELLEIEGEVGELQEPFIHFTYRTVTQFIAKSNAYTNFQARVWRDQGVGWSLRNHVVYGFLRPIGRFAKQYVQLQGFRDGFLGFFVAVMAGWYEFISYIKVMYEPEE